MLFKLQDKQRIGYYFKALKSSKIQDDRAASLASSCPWGLGNAGSLCQTVQSIHSVFPETLQFTISIIFLKHD